jgi:16S rRNA (guanine527-N7)-methyltransferase
LKNFSPLLKQALHENQLTLPDNVQQQLIQFTQLMQTWNRVFNLTNITEPRGMVYLHLIDSLVIAPFLKGTHFLDVGTGAGLPGLPLAIAHPQQQWTLLDKNSKKTRFLTQVVAELGLKNVQVIHSRIEDFHPAQCFDSILSRAFSSIQTFAENTGHLLCQNGLLIAMKGKYPSEELQELPAHVHVHDVSSLAIQGIEVERHVVSLTLTR